MLLFLDGASASGKTTFEAKLLSDDRFHFAHVKRHTTRRIRPGDKPDEYIFVSPSKFESMIGAGKFAEYREFNFSMSYGTSKFQIQRAAKLSDQVVSLINLGGVVSIRKNVANSTCVMIHASKNSLEKRLKERGYHSEEQIAERIENAQNGRVHYEKYDLVIDNSDGKIEIAYAELVRFLQEKLKEEKCYN